MLVKKSTSSTSILLPLEMFYGHHFIMPYVFERKEAQVWFDFCFFVIQSDDAIKAIWCQGQTRRIITSYTRLQIREQTKSYIIFHAICFIEASLMTGLMKNIGFLLDYMLFLYYHQFTLCLFFMLCGIKHFQLDTLVLQNNECFVKLLHNKELRYVIFKHIIVLLWTLQIYN